MWIPEINVLDFRVFGDNILSFIETNQPDALRWANGGIDLPPIKSFYNSPRLVKTFPALTLLQSETSEEFGEIVGGVYSIVLETAIASGNQDYLSHISKKYDYALRSMLANVPETTLSENSIIETSARIVDVQTSFDVLGKQTNQFLQVFQIRASWAVEASAG